MSLESDSRRLAKLAIEKQESVITDPDFQAAARLECSVDLKRGILRLMMIKALGTIAKGTRKHSMLEERALEIFNKQGGFIELCDIAERTLRATQSCSTFHQQLEDLGDGDLKLGIAKRICALRNTPQYEEVMVMHLRSL